LQIIVAALLPESKGYPLENVAEVWHSHWLWQAWFCSSNAATSRPRQDICCHQESGAAPTSDHVVAQLDTGVQPCLTGNP